jgi:hypothetical protein
MEFLESLVQAYRANGLWGETDPAVPLPEGLERGSDAHLAFLALVYTISGGREPVSLWNAARQTFAADPELFEPKMLAYAKARDLLPRLDAYGLLKKAKTEAAVWQRVGQALVMRAGGSVKKLLRDNGNDAGEMLAMLARSKTVFPMLSGEQTALRWLHGLSAAGGQEIARIDELPVPASPAVMRAADGLRIEGNLVPAALFDALDALGRLGCAQRKPSQPLCPAAPACPVARFCAYGGK